MSTSLWAADLPLLALVVPYATRTDMRLAGELDLATVPVLATLLEQQIATGHLDIRIDLADLAFCDVRGVRGLLDGHRRLASAGGRLTLTGPRPLLCRVSVLAGVAGELGWPVDPAPPRTG